MAAAALSRSRGGLLFIFTLLCLVCFAHSQLDKKTREMYKKFIQMEQERLESMKTERAITAELMSHTVSMMDPLAALVKEFKEKVPDFPSLEGFVEDLKDFVVKKKTFVDEQNEHIDEIIERNQQILETLKKLIKFLEEKAEL